MQAQCSYFFLVFSPQNVRFLLSAKIYLNNFKVQNIRIIEAFWKFIFKFFILLKLMVCIILLFHSLIFLENNTGEVTKWNWQSVTQVNGMKNPIMKMTYFLNGPMVNLLLYCHIIIYWEKVTSHGKSWSYNTKLNN